MEQGFADLLVWPRCTIFSIRRSEQIWWGLFGKVYHLQAVRSFQKYFLGLILKKKPSRTYGCGIVQSKWFKRRVCDRIPIQTSSSSCFSSLAYGRKSKLGCWPNLGAKLKSTIKAFQDVNAYAPWLQMDVLVRYTDMWSVPEWIVGSIDEERFEVLFSRCPAMWLYKKVSSICAKCLLWLITLSSQATLCEDFECPPDVVRAP